MQKFYIETPQKNVGENLGKCEEDYRRRGKTDAEGMIRETAQLISRCGPG